MNLLPIGAMVRDYSEENLYPFLDFMASIGMTCCQICRVPEEKLSSGGDNDSSRKFIAELQKRKIEPVSIFLNLRVRSGGNGLVSLPERPARLVSCCRQIAWGARYGVQYFTCHAGVFPKSGTQEYDVWITDMREMIRFAGDLGKDFLFETGPESADDLKQAIEDIGEKNTCVNFDPANLLIYNKTDPAEFAEKLFPYIRLIHCKDSRRPVEGAAMGKETILGEGDTKFFSLLDSLLKKGFRGPLVIEREIPPGEQFRKDVSESCVKLAALRGKYV